MFWLYPDNLKEEDILCYEGFCYIITNLINNKKYIGKKFVYSIRKNRKTKKREKKVSDWLTYESSSDILKSDIKLLGKENFKKEIISVHKTRTETNYRETELLFKYDVLRSKNKTDYNFYNANILHKYFRKNIR